jgi:heme/copper-type cytochrome/quinol oxidase subunit 4
MKNRDYTLLRVQATLGMFYFMYMAIRCDEKQDFVYYTVAAMTLRVLELLLWAFQPQDSNMDAKNSLS